MRNLQSNVSIFGIGIVRQGFGLIRSGEDMRSLCANSYQALHLGLSRLAAIANARVWRTCAMWLKPRTLTVVCLVVVKQPQRRYPMCHRTVA